jgi:hypothetical protein
MKIFSQILEIGESRAKGRDVQTGHFVPQRQNWQNDRSALNGLLRLRILF